MGGWREGVAHSLVSRRDTNVLFFFFSQRRSMLTTMTNRRTKNTCRTLVVHGAYFTRNRACPRSHGSVDEDPSFVHIQMRFANQIVTPL